MFRLVALTALVAICLGQSQKHDHHCCSYEDRHLVMDQWNELWNTPDSARMKITIGHALFDRFLAEDPEAESIFTNVHVDDQESGEWNAHMLRVLGGVNVMVNLMDDTGALNSEIHHLANQHRAREGITPVRFEAFLRIMMEELPHVMTSFNRDAWASCFVKFFQVIAGKVHH